MREFIVITLLLGFYWWLVITLAVEMLWYQDGFYLQHWSQLILLFMSLYNYISRATPPSTMRLQKPWKNKMRKLLIAATFLVSCSNNIIYYEPDALQFDWVDPYQFEYNLLDCRTRDYCRAETIFTWWTNFLQTSSSAYSWQEAYFYSPLPWILSTQF